MLKQLLATLAVVSVGASFVVFGSFAIFTDSQSVPANTFSTGTLDLSTNPTSALVTFSGMAPNDEVTNPITVSNAGFDTDGTVIYGPSDLGSAAGTNVIGDPTQGADTGDRTLNASANETLCFNVELPSSTGNTYQGLTTTATLNFQAEQTSSNP